jgi:hypothetical protein
VLALKGAKLNVIVDTLSDREEQIAVTFGNETDFAAPAVTIRNTRGSTPDPIEIVMNYGDSTPSQRYLLSLCSFCSSISGAAGALGYHSESLRIGTLTIAGVEHRVAIKNEPATGDFSELQNVSFAIEVDGVKTHPQPADLPLLIHAQYFVVTDVSSAGSRLSLRGAELGAVKGKVVEAATGAPVAGAAVSLLPKFAETTTNSAGEFRIETPEGRYFRIQVRAKGYVPSSEEFSGRLSAGSTADAPALKLKSDTIAAARSGITRLRDRDSFHFLSGETTKLQGGDFYMGFDGANAAKFWANNQDQNGLVSLGDIGTGPLERVTPVADAKFQKFGVPVVRGQTYVSQAKTGEDGHYVIFRVRDIRSSEYVEIEYLYR